MTQKQLAIIQEQNCIGCTKCIDACPTDAIIGADQLMHTVVLVECIGCMLCVPACPVDCIDLISVPEDYVGMPKEVINSRIKRRKTRLQLKESIFASNETLDDRKQYILNALTRAKKNKV